MTSLDLGFLLGVMMIPRLRLLFSSISFLRAHSTNPTFFKLFKHTADCIQHLQLAVSTVCDTDSMCDPLAQTPHLNAYCGSVSPPAEARSDKFPV
jgi:hypothetical protein